MNCTVVCDLYTLMRFRHIHATCYQINSTLTRCAKASKSNINLSYKSMPTELAGTLWFSEKRMRLLLLLAENKQDIEHIKRSLNVSSRDIMPLIKKLKKSQLIIEERQIFSLTPIAELLVSNMRQFLETSRVICENMNFWETRSFKSIPICFTERIGELGHYLLIEPDLHSIYDFPNEFKDNVVKCKDVTILSSYMHPTYPPLCLKILGNVDIFSLFIVPELLDNIHTEREFAKNLLTAPNTNVFLIDRTINIPMLCVTENFVYIGITNTDDLNDHRDILSFDKTAVQWGKELIEYYRDQSTDMKKDAHVFYLDKST